MERSRRLDERAWLHKQGGSQLQCERFGDLSVSVEDVGNHLRPNVHSSSEVRPRLAPRFDDVLKQLSSIDIWLSQAIGFIIAE